MAFSQIPFLTSKGIYQVNQKHPHPQKKGEKILKLNVLKLSMQEAWLYDLPKNQNPENIHYLLHQRNEFNTETRDFDKKI